MMKEMHMLLMFSRLALACRNLPRMPQPPPLEPPRGLGADLIPPYTLHSLHPCISAPYCPSHPLALAFKVKGLRRVHT